MRNNISTLLFLGLAFFLSSQEALAQAKLKRITEDCQKILTKSGNIQINRDSLNEDISYVSIHPFNTTDLTYRDYLITTEGLLMVFNSYGEGPISETTAAREFYFFPRQAKCLQVWIDETNEDVIVAMPNGAHATFDAKSADIKSISGGVVKVDAKVHDGNRGGVEILNYKGLMLDVGFRKGASPSELAKAKVHFINEKGVKCQVLNKDIFAYKNDDVIFKFEDIGLGQFLTTKCGRQF
jgi:hypothetical protein